MITDKLGEISSIRIQNFRLFKNNKFDFKPFTILVGPNSSGKSSFIKSLLLLKSKTEGRVTGESSGFDYFNDEHQLGDMSLFKNKGKQLKYELFWKEGFSVEFALEDALNEQNTDRVVYRRLKLKKGVVIEQKSILRKIKLDGNEFDIYDGVFDIEFSLLIKYMGLLINSFERIAFNNSFDLYRLEDKRVLGASFDDLLKEFHDSKDDSLEIYKTKLFETVYMTSLAMNYLANKLDSLRQYELLYKSLKKECRIVIDRDTSIMHYRYKKGELSKLTTEEEVLMVVTDIFKYYRRLFPIMTEVCLTKSIGDTNIVYVPALKGLHQRYLPLNDTSALSKLMDAEKSNFRGGRKSKVYNFHAEIAQDSLNKPWFQPSKEFVEKWIKVFNIGSHIKMEKDRLRGIKFIDIDGGSLVDKGYGLTQLTAVILSIANAMEIEGTVILEEPEANLHPKYQSMLAEMLVEAKIYYDVSFIIETHSEYLIRKLQYLTAKKKIKADDTIIYYFHHPDEIPKGEKQIKKLTIREDGMMDGDFGEGFFDESSRLTMDLLKIQTQN